MAQYTFQVDSFRIDNTRARHNDTDFVSLGLQIGSTKFPVLTKSMGDLNNGVYHPGLQFGPIEIPDDQNIPVIFNYQIVNSGYGNTGAILDALRKFADELINKALQPPADQGQPQSTSPGDSDETTSNFFKWAAGEFIRYAVLWGLDLIFADCDGPVAIDTIKFDGHGLSQLRATGHSEARRYVIESQRGCGSSPDYQVTWSVVPHVVQPPVNYTRITNKHSSEVLDVVGLSQADGANVQQYKWNGGANQLWALVQVEPNYVKIVNQNSGKVLDVVNLSQADGANVQQYTWNGGDNQRWLIEPVDTGYVKVENKHSHKVLDVVGLSMTDGANVQQYTWNGGDNQKWKLG